MPPKRKAAAAKTSNATKKAKTTPASTAEATTAATKKSHTPESKDPAASPQCNASETAVVAASGPCPSCGKAAGISSEAVPRSNGGVDLTGRFAWFDLESEELKSVAPTRNPTAATWAAVYARVSALLASNESHRATFTLKAGYRGKRAYLRGPSGMPTNMADNVLASRGAEIFGGFIGDVEFTDDDIPIFYPMDLDLSCVHGFEARLAAPPRMGIRGQGRFKMRRVWVDPCDPSKELFEGIWDLTVFTDNRHSRWRYGMEDDGDNSGALFCAIRHAGAEEALDESDDERCFY